MLRAETAMKKRQWMEKVKFLEGLKRMETVWQRRYMRNRAKWLFWTSSRSLKNMQRGLNQRAEERNGRNTEM